MEVRRLPNDVLEHHGIEGQRWGVRRYQNEDGTLTAAGRKRYGYYEQYKQDVRKRIAGRVVAYGNTGKDATTAATDQIKAEREANKVSNISNLISTGMGVTTAVVGGSIGMLPLVTVGSVMGLSSVTKIAINKLKDRKLNELDDEFKKTTLHVVKL